MISIIIPIYKVEEFLPATLDSVLAQTDSDWECILVDDGSPDGSGAICDRYAARDSRFKVIHQTNAGVSAARNAGIEAARGEYLTFLDGDDRIAPDFSEKMRAALDEGADLAFCEYRRVTPAGKELYDSRYREKLAPIMEQGRGASSGVHFGCADSILSAFWASGMLSNSCCKLFRGAILRERNLRFPEGFSYAEDSLFAARYSTFCRKIAFVNAVLYDYLSREGSLSNGWWAGMLTQRSRSLTDIALMFGECNAPLTKAAVERMRDSLNPEFLLEGTADPKERKKIIGEYCALPNYSGMLAYVKTSRSRLTYLIYRTRSPLLIGLYLSAVLKKRGAQG